MFYNVAPIGEISLEIMMKTPFISYQERWLKLWVILGLEVKESHSLYVNIKNIYVVISKDVFVVVVFFRGGMFLVQSNTNTF